MENYTENFNDLIKEYLYKIDGEESISIDERIAVLISKINSKNNEGFYYLAYTIKLIKKIFSEEERINNINFTIIKDNEVLDLSKPDILSAILTVNKRGFTENPEYNIYYYLNSDTGILPISKNNLQERFDNRTYEYINEDDQIVPGINTRELPHIIKM